MGSRRGGNILMALGVVLAVIGGGLAFVMTQTAVGNAQRVEVPKKDVVMAKADITEGTILTTDKLELVKWPEDVIPPGAITDMKDLQGKFAKVRIGARSPLNQSQIGGKDVDKLATQPAPAGQTTAAKGPKVVEQEYLLEKGQVLVAVTYPSASALIQAGAVKPGSRVDVIVRTPGATSDQIAPVFRNIQIRAIGSVNPDTEKAGNTLIFAVPPQDALVLKYIEAMNPDLVLRSAADGPNENPGTDLVTQDYIINKYKLQRPPAATGGAAPAPPGGRGP